MYILLDDAKQHLNIDKDFHGDDEYIINLIQAAEDVVSKRIDEHLNILVDPRTGYLPKSVIQSILLLIGTWYANRETYTTTSANELPQGFEYLANLNKNYSSGF